MAYLVTAMTERGALSIQCDTAIAAHEKATQVAVEGASDVLITDPEGQVYAPADFARRHLQEGAGEG